MKLMALLAFLLFGISAALAQNVTVIGPVTPGNVPQFNSTTTIKDSGVAGGAALFANPTGAVGLSTVNGSALTAMRSDAAPPLSASVQSALTGTNGNILTGTGAFGFSSVPAVPLANGGLGASQAGATANQIPVYPGSGGAAAPTTIGGTGGLFDTICSSTIGQIWVRLSSGWGCTAFGYANPVWWGADPTGAADSTSALNSALAATPDVRFPKGKFKFLSAITYNLAAGIASVSLQGAGQDNTILTWPNASGGITINYAGFGSTSHIRDLSFTTGTTAGGSAVTLNQSSAGSGFPAVSDVYRVGCRGDDGYILTDYWTNCINIANVSNVQIEDLAAFGPSSANGTGINLIGLPGSSAYGIVYNIAKSLFYNLTTGITYGSFIQGVTVDQSNFQSLTGSSSGINIPASQTGTLDQLSVTNSQFQVSVNAIATSTTLNHVMLANNLFFLPANGIGLNFNPAVGFTLNGNYITCNSATGTFGINLAATSNRGNITGNVISGCGTGINVQASTINTNINGNTLAANTTAIGYAATGATNTIVNNPGYNPVGGSGITVGASPFTYTAGPSPETIYINNGTISTIGFAKNGGSFLGVAVNAGSTSVDLGPNEQVQVTYTAAPGMNKMVH